jgi:hypothetical protein
MLNARAAKNARAPAQVNRKCSTHARNARKKMLNVQQAKKNARMQRSDYVAHASKVAM